MENIDIQQGKANRLLAALQEAEDRIRFIQGAEDRIRFIQGAVGTDAETTIDFCSSMDTKKFLSKQLLLLEKKLLSSESAADTALIANSIAEIGKTLIKF